MKPPKAPEAVFTPTTVASLDMFERRNEPDRFGNPGLQDRLVESLRQSGSQLRVFGDTGVGKTSLVVFAAQEAARKPLVVECRSSHDYADLLEQAIHNIQGVKLTSYVKKRDVAVEAEAAGGFKFVASIRGKITGRSGKERNFEIVDKVPLELLIDLMTEQGYDLLVLDNFHNVNDTQTRVEIAQTMEVLSDRADRTGDLKLVVIGIAEDAHTLLTPSKSVRRRTIDVGVPRMPDDEIRGVLSTGFKLLELAIDAEYLDHLVFYSDGFPFFAHLIGLNISRAARRQQSGSVEPVHVSAGLLRSANEVDETYASRVRLAIEAGGKVQPKRRLLTLLALSSARTWTCAEAKMLWLNEYSGDPKKLQFIDVAMGSLIKPENGAVLTRDESSTPYRYRFDDPHFRAYLRIKTELGDGAERESLAGTASSPAAPPTVYRDSLT